jgi:DNA-binding MarR family transcriptional regulator
MNNKLETSIGYVIASTRRIILKELNAAFIENDIPLTIEQFIFLNSLKNMPGEVTQQDIANQICKDKSAVLRTIDILEKKELVERHQVSGDRRKNILSLTPKCEELFDRILEIEGKTMNRMISGINEEDIKCAIKVLNHIQLNVTNNI